MITASALHAAIRGLVHARGCAEFVEISAVVHATHQFWEAPHFAIWVTVCASVSVMLLLRGVITRRQKSM